MMTRLRSARPRRAVLVLVLILLGIPALAGVSSAASNPLDCYPAPSPEWPGQGFVGWLDTPELGKGIPNTPYDDVSYAGLTWNTYGYSGACVSSDPSANMSNWTANELFSMAKGIVSAVNGLHWMIQDQTGLQSLDDVVIELVAVFYDNIYVVLLGLALIIASVSVFVLVLRGDLAAIGARAFGVAVALWLASTTFFVPMLWVGMTDNVLVRGAQELETSLLSSQGSAGPQDLPTILHDQVVVQPWLLGEFGAVDSPEAQKYGRDLMLAQACTKDERLYNSCNTEAKEAEYKRIAGELENTPAASTFSGEAGRMGPAIIALSKALALGSFQLFAKAGLLLLQLLARGVVVAGPLLGLFAIMNIDVLPKVGKTLLLTVTNGLILTLAGASQTWFIAYITDPVRDLAPTLQVFLIAGTTALLLMAIKPWRRLQEMPAAVAGIQLRTASERAMSRNMRRMRRGRRRWLRRFANIGGGEFDEDFWLGSGEDAQPPPQPQQPTSPSTELDVSRAGGYGRRPEATTRYVSSQRVHEHGEYPRAGQIKRPQQALESGESAAGDRSGRGGPAADPGGDGTGQEDSRTSRSRQQRHTPRELPAASRDQRPAPTRSTPVYRPEESSSETPRRTEGTEQPRPQRPARPSSAAGQHDAREVYRPVDDTDADAEPPHGPRPEGER